ncbi:MAG: endonuclease domain-containing protein, partial [Proteobacteria bacterium]|nr:endonuclease domain-containing protein [Pseudomonadota bacterium]
MMSRRELLELARLMRGEPTRSEAILWEALRNRQVCGVKFRRQQVIDRFIVDFFAPSHNLVLEIDGASHKGREEHDAAREQFLTDNGLTIIRFSAKEVENSPSSVIEKIKHLLNKTKKQTKCSP